MPDAGDLIVPTGLRGPPGSGGEGAAGIWRDVSPPASPNGYALWWDEADAQLYVWTGAEWVIAVNIPGSAGPPGPQGATGPTGGQGPAGAGASVSATAPQSPLLGQFWWDTVSMALYVWTGIEWAAT